MSWTVDSSGTQSAVIGTLHALATSTSNATFIFEVDLSALAAGEAVQLMVSGITLSGGTAAQMWSGTFGAPRINPRVQAPPTPSDVSISVSLRQVNGTGRAFPWKLIRA